MAARLPVRLILSPCGRRPASAASWMWAVLAAIIPPLRWELPHFASFPVSGTPLPFCFSTCGVAFFRCRHSSSQRGLAGRLLATRWAVAHPGTLRCAVRRTPDGRWSCEQGESRAEQWGAGQSARATRELVCPAEQQHKSSSPDMAAPPNGAQQHHVAAVEIQPKQRLRQARRAAPLQASLLLFPGQRPGFPPPDLKRASRCCGCRETVRKRGHCMSLPPRMSPPRLWPVTASDFLFKLSRHAGEGNNNVEKKSTKLTVHTTFSTPSLLCLPRPLGCRQDETFASNYMRASITQPHSTMPSPSAHLFRRNDRKENDARLHMRVRRTISGTSRRADEQEPTAGTELFLQNGPK